MGVDFEPGPHSRASYEARRDACTAQALGELVNDPEYKTWALRKAKREQRQLVLSNVLLAASFGLFCLSLAYCKPGAAAQVTSVASTPRRRQRRAQTRAPA